jgi:hypothetical protein
MWGAFSFSVFGFFTGLVSFERFVLVSILLLAILLEEQFYLIKEKIIDARKV